MIDLEAVGFPAKGAMSCSMTSESVDDAMEDLDVLLASKIVRTICYVNHHEFGARFVKLKCGKTKVVLELTAKSAS